MTRVFEKHELEAAAERASAAARADVLKRFYAPVVGTLRCKFVGTQDPAANDLIVYATNVVFSWELSAPHVKGSVEQALFCVVPLCADSSLCFAEVSSNMQTHRGNASEYAGTESSAPAHEQASTRASEHTSARKERTTIQR